MKKSRLLGHVCACVFIFFASTPAWSATVTMDFNGLSVGTTNIGIAAPYQEDGYSLDQYGVSVPSPFFGMFGTDDQGYTGQKSLYQGWQGGSIGAILSQDGGGQFDLISIDLIEYRNLASFLSPNTTDVLFEGLKSDSTTISQSFVLDGSWGFETFNFLGFTNLVSVKWNIDGGTVGGFSEFHQFDNIVLSTSTVPIPAALYLFGTGLLGLGVMARRKKETVKN